MTHSIFLEDVFVPSIVGPQYKDEDEEVPTVILVLPDGKFQKPSRGWDFPLRTYSLFESQFSHGARSVKGNTLRLLHTCATMLESFLAYGLCNLPKYFLSVLFDRCRTVY